MTTKIFTNRPSSHEVWFGRHIERVLQKRQFALDLAVEGSYSLAVAHFHEAFSSQPRIPNKYESHENSLQNLKNAIEYNFECQLNSLLADHASNMNRIAKLPEEGEEYVDEMSQALQTHARNIRTAVDAAATIRTVSMWIEFMVEEGVTEECLESIQQLLDAAFDV